MIAVYEFITIKQAYRYQHDYHNRIPNKKENKKYISYAITYAYTLNSIAKKNNELVKLSILIPIYT